ncbi:hypothetical protein EMCRGX_G014572 [Ephydatia muelleri]
MMMTNEDQDSASVFYSDPHTVIALDVHYRLGLVFWISNEADSITSYVKMATLNSAVVNPSIISNGTTLSALAVDWISDRVYWTNTNDRQIKVFDISTGSILVFMDTGYDTSPLGIAVDPIKGWIYWSDGQQQNIQRASILNTSWKQVIKQSSSPRCATKYWPIALNITSQVLYWSISCYGMLEKIVVGDVMSTVIQNTGGAVSSITYTSNWLWWSDGKYIKKKDMNASTSDTVICISSDFVRISALQAVDKSRQPNAMPLASPTPADIERQVIKLPVSVPLLNVQTASLTTTEKPKVAITSTHSAQGSSATSTNLMQNKVAVSTQTTVQNRPVQQTRTGSAVQVMTSSSKLVKISPITSPVKSAPIKTNTASIQGTRTVAGNSAVNTPSMVPSSIPQQTLSALISTVSSSIPQQTPSALISTVSSSIPQQTPSALISTVSCSIPQQTPSVSSQLNAPIASSEVPSGDSAVTTVLKISETLTPSSISMTAAIEALGTATVSYNDHKISAETIIPSSSTAIAFSEQSSATPLVTFITTIESSSPALYEISTSTPALSTAFASSPAALSISTSSPAPSISSISPFTASLGPFISSPAASSISTSSPAPFSTIASSSVVFTTHINLLITPHVSIISKITNQSSRETLSSKTTATRSETPSISSIQNKLVRQSTSVLTSLAISLAVVSVTAVLLIVISILLTIYCIRQRRFLKLRDATVEPDEIFPSNKTMYNPVYISPDVINPIYMRPGLSPIH